MGKFSGSTIFEGIVIAKPYIKKRREIIVKEYFLKDEDIEKELERVCKKLFNSTMFNFACLMNNAYRDNEKPHVHFHFIPRYNGERVILNKNYKDKHFGYNLWKWALNKFKSQKDIFNKEEKIKIFEMMKNEFMKNK